MDDKEKLTEENIEETAEDILQEEEDLSYLFEPEDEHPEADWVDTEIEEAGSEDAVEADSAEAAGAALEGEDEDAGEEAEEADETDEAEEAEDGYGADEKADADSDSDADVEADADADADYDAQTDADADADYHAQTDADAADDADAEGEDADGEEGEWKETTISTQNFYELYGDEIRAYLSGHEEEDPIEEYEELEEEQAEKEGVVPKKKKKRRKKHYLIRFLVIVGVIVATVCFLMSSYFDIKQIDVEGTKTLKKSNVIKQSGIQMGTNIFKLHKKDVEQKLLESSYIAHVEVKRDYPGTVKLTILERRESAAVKYGSEYLIIDPDGYVLRKVKKLPKRTLLSDMKIKEIEIGKKLEVNDEKRFAQALEIIKAMKETDIYFKKIEFTKTKVRAFIYDSLVCVGTYDDLLKNIKNGNLPQVARDLYSKKIRKGTVKIDGGKFISYDPSFK